MQINGLNIKLVNGGKENEKKTGHSSDQWIKLKQNTKRTTRTSSRNPENNRNTRTKWVEFKVQGRTITKRRQKIKRQQQPKEEGRTNFPKVIGRNKFVRLKLFHS